MVDCLIRPLGMRPPCWCSAAVAVEEPGRWLSAAISASGCPSGSSVTVLVSRFDTVRGGLLDVYAEVRAPLLHLPNYAVTAFGERLDRHGTESGFVAVLAYADGHPVGYTYGNTIEHGDRYWQRTTPAQGGQVHRAPSPGPGPQGDRRPAGLAEDRHRPPYP